MLNVNIVKNIDNNNNNNNAKGHCFTILLTTPKLLAIIRFSLRQNCSQ